MRKKLFSVILATCMILPSAFALNACGGGGGNGTKGLEYIKYSGGYGVRVGKATDSDIVIPATYKNEPVVSIDNNAFKDCTFITSVTIPDSVSSIYENAFSGCTSLTSIEIPDTLFTLKYGAFRGCTSLTSITLPFMSSTMEYADQGQISHLFGVDNTDIPESLKQVILTGGTKIGNNAFKDCSHLTDIIIPDGTTSIGKYAFDGCDSITNFMLPASVTEIDVGAFDNCNSLENVYYKGTMETWCNISFAKNEESYHGVTARYANPMYGAEHFYMYEAGTDVPYEASEIIIPNTITSIGKYQFCGFNNLGIVTIPKSVTAIGEDAFFGCSITDVYYQGSEAEWLSINGYDELVKDGVEFHYNVTITQ